jgi:NAD(P)H-dependent FMN reductase
VIDSPLRLQIVVGSTRPERAADVVAPWVLARAAGHAAFAVEVLDLREWSLPPFGETPASVGDPNDPSYSSPVVRSWNAKIRESDAYVFITPEYNHTVPASIKTAIESVYQSYAFRNKPAAFVGYSAGIGAGIRAVEHLIQIAVEAELVPLRTAVQIANVRSAFTDGQAVNPMTSRTLDVMLEDLCWWSRVLRAARLHGQLPPAGQRLVPTAARSGSA